MPTLDELTWLASADGRAVCREMDQEYPADSPAHIAHWRERLEPGRVAVAWGQVLLRRQARHKFAQADGMLLDRVGLEQATDEIVAAHKARRFEGLARVADLCCGIGGDALALAATTRVTAVDWSEPRTFMTRHNASAYGRQVETLAEDVAFCRPEVDAIHIDPDRRPGGPRRHEPEAGSPNLEILRQIVGHYAHAAIKLSPGADFGSLGINAEIELIGLAGECKQAVAWTGRFQQAYRRATVLPGGESIAATATDDLAWPASQPVEPGAWLFEPDAAVIRADLVGRLARKSDLAPIDPLIAYLVGSTPVFSGLLRAFRVLEVADFSAAAVRRLLKRHEVGLLEIKSRGFACRPEEIRRWARPKGRRAGTLILTRIAGRPRAILAERPEPACGSPCNACSLPL
ncbi:MAG TPA: class I SAM-dependent methyltransferase [Phycisphaerae bacterium]|nr:class I SAM-dependent methyltransferase [Phycisphaerae bacterium]